MKYKLPIVTLLSIAAGIAGWQTKQKLDRDAAAVNSSNSAAPSEARHRPTPSPAEGRGQKIVQQTVQSLLKIRALSAELRQRIDMFDQQLVGIGTYKQMMVADLSLVRMEMNIPVSADETERWLQISDGRSLWTRRTGPQTKSLEVINLTRVQQVMESQETFAVDKVAASWMVLGGLPKLVDSLAKNFEFSSPVGKRIQDVPIWEVTGRWKKDVLKRMRGKATKPLPPHVPDQVRLVLGRGEPLPLFPYRIEFGRSGTGQGGKEGQGPRSPGEFKRLVTLEFFRVQLNPKLDTGAFQFSPGEQSVVDRTDAVLEQLR